MGTNYTRIDDIAYDLYYLDNRKKGADVVYKYYFILHKDIFDEYYYKANIILRKEKLIKLQNGV